MSPFREGIAYFHKTPARYLMLRTGLLVALILLYIWPAIYNGQPLFFIDTTAYVRGADAGFWKVIHQRTVWSNEASSITESFAGKQGPSAAQQLTNSTPPKVVLAGRSVYYGALLYLGHLTGRLWPTVIVQAVSVLLAICLTLRVFGLFTWWRLSLTSVVLAIATPMPFFVSYLMPDIFAGITILAIANLLSVRQCMSGRVAKGWLVLLTVSLLFHTSHVLLTVLMLVIVVVGAALARISFQWTTVAAIVAVILVAEGGEVLFSVATKKFTGAAPIRPPFLMARIVMDGPGYRYLLASCPQSGFAVCAFVPRIPNLSKRVSNWPPSDEFLWNDDPAIGVFTATDAITKRKLGNEQFRFALGSVLFDPVGVLSASVRDSLQQISLFSLEEFSFDEGARNFFFRHLPDPYFREMKSSRIWQDTMPLRTLSQLTILSTIISSLFIGTCLVLRKRAFDRHSGLLLFSSTIVAGIVINAFICGAMSTPHDRYQARVIWLLPFTAILIQQSLPKIFWRRSQAKREYHDSWTGDTQAHFPRTYTS